MKIININGPMNAGKTTISKLLVSELKVALFIEVDDLLSDEEQKVLGLSREEGWRERIKRLNTILSQEKEKAQYEYIIFAYPMTEKLYWQWKSLENTETAFINITLAPQLEICLQNRGDRELNDKEKDRIKEMYQQGYHNSVLADLIIDNSAQSPNDTLQQILAFLGF